MATDMTMNPMERLRIETSESNGIGKQLGELLLSAMDGDKPIIEKYRNKTLEMVIKFVTDTARTKAVNGSYAATDKEVLGWALHYIQDIEETAKPSVEKTTAKTVEPKKVEKVEAVKEETKPTFETKKAKKGTDEKQISIFDSLFE